MTSRNVWAVIVSLVLAFALFGSTPAAAQDGVDTSATKTEVKPDFKGAIGLGLIGAELGFVIPALAGAKGVWPYIVFPVAGATGGAVAGYFLLEKGEGHPELAVATLTVGMALVVPALVATIAATAYRPPEQIKAARQRGRELALLGGASAGGFVRFAEGSLRLAPPAVSSGPTLTPRQALRTGERRVSSLRVAMLSAQF